MTPSSRRPADSTARPARLVAAACFSAPAAVLAACYVWLAADHGTPRLWSVVVHESGRYTLGQSVLYFSHFLREVPTDVAYALFLLGAGGGLSGPARAETATRARALGLLGLGAAALLLAGALLITANADGWSSAFRDLMQFRTRDDVMAYGSHWRYHWLSTVWFGATVGLAGPAIARLARGRPIVRSSSWERAAWGYFVVLTLIFGFSRDVFADTRYVGHQAREILTHGPVTALLGIGLLLVSRKWLGAVDSAGGPVRVWLRLAAAVAIPAYLAVVALTGDVMAAGQSDAGLAAMVAAHYFEHSLDYLLVALLVIGVLGVRVTYGPAVDHLPPDSYGVPSGRARPAP